jgi:hypothetical protein
VECSVVKNKLLVEICTAKSSCAVRGRWQQNWELGMCNFCIAMAKESPEAATKKYSSPFSLSLGYQDGKSFRRAHNLVRLRLQILSFKTCHR